MARAGKRSKGEAHVTGPSRPEGPDDRTDESAAVEAMLASPDWQRRLALARQKREAVLASRPPRPARNVLPAGLGRSAPDTGWGQSADEFVFAPSVARNATAARGTVDGVSAMPVAPATDGRVGGDRPSDADDPPLRRTRTDAGPAESIAMAPAGHAAAAAPADPFADPGRFRHSKPSRAASSAGAGGSAGDDRSAGDGPQDRTARAASPRPDPPPAESSPGFPAAAATGPHAGKTRGTVGRRGDPATRSRAAADMPPPHAAMAAAVAPDGREARGRRRAGGIAVAVAGLAVAAGVGAVWMPDGPSGRADPPADGIAAMGPQ